MSKNTKWDFETEKFVLKRFTQGVSIAEISRAINRSNNAVRLRIQKIIYDTVSNNKSSVSSLAQKLNKSVEMIQQYFDSYSNFIDKHQNNNNNDNNKLKHYNDNKTMKTLIHKLKSENKLSHIPSSYQDILKENEIMREILKNYALKKKLKKLKK